MNFTKREKVSKEPHISLPVPSNPGRTAFGLAPSELSLTLSASGFTPPAPFNFKAGG